ncbi:Zn-ribbon domain-containing OB-fold protein [Rhodococcus koreensis]
MSRINNEIRPDTTDPLLAPFWEGCRNHLLLVQKCDECRDIRFPPLPICPHCWSESQEWVETDPTGTLWSYVIYRRAMHPALADQIPYAIGRVTTSSGAVFETRLDIPLDEIEIGMPLVATFKDLNDELSLLQFTKR